MKTFKMPRTDLEVSALGLGTVNYGSSIKEDDAFRLMDEYVELGGNVLDTANVYGDWVEGTKSLSEKVIGQWLTARGMHGKVIISTKGAHPHLDSMDVPRVTPKDILFDLEQSLEHLQTDVIDLYWLHRDDPNVPVGEILQTLHEAQQQGKIRWYGCSNWTLPRIIAAEQYAKEHDMSGFIANQLMFSLSQVNSENLSDPTMVIMDDKTHDYYAQGAGTIFAYCSQAHGFFCGDYQQGQPLPDRPSAATVQNLHYNDENFARLARATELASQLDLTPQQVAVRYCISQPYPVVALAGSRTLDQLHDSAKAVADILPTELVEYLLTGE